MGGGGGRGSLRCYKNICQWLLMWSFHTGGFGRLLQALHINPAGLMLVKVRHSQALSTPTTPHLPTPHPHCLFSFLIWSQIMLLTDPEVESSLLISLDEGASYQKHGLAFDILSLLFHPEQEDWILAYSHDQKVIPTFFMCEDTWVWNRGSRGGSWSGRPPWLHTWNWCVSDRPTLTISSPAPTRAVHRINKQQTHAQTAPLWGLCCLLCSTRPNHPNRLPGSPLEDLILQTSEVCEERLTARGRRWKLRQEPLRGSEELKRFAPQVIRRRRTTRFFSFHHFWK